MGRRKEIGNRALRPQLARVEVGPEDERKLVRFNGKPAIGLGVLKQSNANTIDVVAGIRTCNVRHLRKRSSQLMAAKVDQVKMHEVRWK